MHRLLRLSLILVVAVTVSLAGCSPSDPDGVGNRIKLQVVVAGSLIVPFQTLESEFERLNPDIDVELEAHGSVQVVRSVTELGVVADLIAVADAQLIPLMMYPARQAGGDAYADWTIRFSTNRLGIAYHASSAYASEISAENWPVVISRPDVAIGLADPRIDAMGYRTLMVIQLAEGYYRDDTIFERTVGAALNPPVVIADAGGLATIAVPEVVRSTESKLKVRSYSIQLLALLESGDLDYTFEYESVAKQRGLQFLALPSAIDLSSPEYEENYRKVEVNLDFRRFASVVPSFPGARIVYGLSIPKNAQNPAAAARLVDFLLAQEGKRIFEQAWQPLLSTPVCDNPESLPQLLRPAFR